MHINTGASDPSPASEQPFGYREALAEIVTDLGQTTAARHDRPRRRRSPAASARAVKQPDRRSVSRPRTG